MRRFTLAVLTILLTAGTGIAHAEDHIQILRTGLWHGDEVDAESGPDWWGIFPAGDGFTLQSAPVTITREFDAIIDNAPEEKTGKRVTVPQEAESVLLVRGIPGLAQGPLEIPPGLKNIDRFRPGQTLDIRLAVEEQPERVGLYSLGKLLTFSGPGDLGQEDLEIVVYQVKAGKTSEQSLGRVPGVTDGTPRLEWAGDLDRDGKVDMLLNLTDHYNVTHLVLFLSSAAKEGEIVGRVAEWRTTGC